MSYTNGLDKPTDYFNTKLYTGTGSAQSITGVGFQPEMSWFKQRNTTRGHVLEDIVRGAGNTLFPNDTSSETAGGYYLTSFDSDGFTLPSSNVGTNENSGTYASWNWKAGGSASSNSNGSITSSVSANTTAGFSISQYTGTGSAGATVGHGLGVAPKMIIAKGLTYADVWIVGGDNLGGWNKEMYLNFTSAVATNNNAFNGVTPTSSVFTLGSGNGTNKSGDDYIAYCFAEKKGYSKFGSYTGNGNADGTFIYTGQKSAFIMIKRTDSTDGWAMFDNKRNPHNTVSQRLWANESSAEAGTQLLDFLSNGFKPRYTNSYFNGSGSSYIYMAFAENPFVTSTGVPATAR